MKEVLVFPHEIKGTESLSFSPKSASTYLFRLNEREKADMSLFLTLEDSSLPPIINFEIGEASELRLSLFVKGESGSYQAEFNLESDSSINLVTADCFIQDFSSHKVINLKGNNAEAQVYEYVSTANKEKATGDFLINHFSSNTTASGVFVYLAKDDSEVKKEVVSNIQKGMKNSVSSENIKGVLLSPKAKIEAKPILKIDFDDVHASHGCAIGTLDDNEIYYLMSRGLTKEDATKIICESLINPVIEASKDQEYRSLISPLLEKSIGSE